MTDQVAQYKELLRALFKDDTQAAQRIAAEHGDSSWEGTGSLLMAVFGTAIDRRFTTDGSHAAIMSFVREAEDAFRSAGQAFNPLYAELLVRAVLGEDELIQQVPRDDATALMMPLADKAVSDLKLSDAEVDKLLDDAEALISQ